MFKIPSAPLLGAIAAGALAFSLSPDAVAMTTAQQRLLCVQLSGDLADPGGLAEFRRCMNAAHPIAALKRNALPPRRRIPGLVASRPAALVEGTGVPLAGAGARRDLCPRGYVWREARADDHHCVTPSERAAARARRLSR
jgi:hypothetical protein